jgi:hypothetical protein
MYLMSVVALTMGVSVSTALPAAAYTPGTATPYTPHYDPDTNNTGGYSYHCNFAHWRSGAKVTWHCDLYERYLDKDTGWKYDPLSLHSGSWTPGSTSYTTKTWLHKLVVGEGQLCTQARALSVDGGTVTKLACT